MAKASFLGVPLPWNESSTKTISKIFEKYETKLDAQKLSMADEIKEWRAALTQSIENYVYRQIGIIERRHAEQAMRLEEARKQCYAELKIHRDTENTERINELIERCEQLKFEIPAFETVVQTIPFKSMPRKQQKATRQDSNRSTVELQNNSFDNITQLDNDDQDEYRFSFDYRSSSRRSINNSESQLESDENERSNPNDAPKECPTCFMLFGTRVTSKARWLHINSHSNMG